MPTTFRVSDPMCSADSSARRCNQSPFSVVNLSPKPIRPIAGTEHIRLPEWCDRSQLTQWVRRQTAEGIDLQAMELIGSRATSMRKGLQRAILFQQALIRSEGWPHQQAEACVPHVQNVQRFHQGSDGAAGAASEQIAAPAPH